MKYKGIVKLNILIILSSLLLLCGCSANVAEKTEEKFSVVALGFPQYDLARAVCGSDENIKMLIRPGAEVHGYEPSLSDIIAVENADVVIYNGGESDAWLERIFAGIDTSDTILINLMETPGISLYKYEHSHHTHSGDHSHNHDTHHKGEGYDEHIWTSPKNYALLLDRVAKELSLARPQMEAEYRENALGYAKEISSLDTELEKLVSACHHPFIAVADKFPFLYLAKDYGIDYIAGFTGCSAENDAGGRVLVEMVKEIEHHSLSYVFYIELSNQKMATALCEHTGAEKLLLHSCQNVSADEFKSGKTYVDIMKENINNLKEALS